MHGSLCLSTIMIIAILNHSDKGTPHSPASNPEQSKLENTPTPASASESNQSTYWSRFRGPNGSGISTDKGIPVQWEDGNYAWDVTLPGVGHSSPCIWNEHLFLTTAIEDGLRRSIISLNAKTGEIRWIRELESKTFKKHLKNSYASSTPATDGKYVFVSFNTEEHYSLLAYDFHGNKVWDLDLGAFQSQHGAGVSPIVEKGIVYLANDQDGTSFLIAVDAKTGELIWKNDRGSDATSYSTPLILNRPGLSPEVVFASKAEGIASFDAKTGEQLWKVDPIEHRTVSSLTFGDGLLIQTAGGGGKGYFLVALRPGKKPAQTEVVWTRDKDLPYVPTPIIYKGYLFLWGDNGVVRCLEAASGKEIWTQRVGQAQFSGSPVCVDGKLYCMSETGEVFVVRAAPQYEPLGRSSLGDPSHSTPAVSGGRLYLRTFHRLFCIGSSENTDNQ